jgi:hypothetical protein
MTVLQRWHQWPEGFFVARASHRRVRPHYPTLTELETSPAVVASRGSRARSDACECYRSRCF